MHALGASDLAGQRALLERLTRLTTSALRIQSTAQYRFSAASAYAKIVGDRIDFLRLERLEGAPSMSSFLLAALSPAMRTCHAVSARLDAIADTSRLTINLLRATLTVEQQAQNMAQLRQLESTARTQLLLQESVEGLSVVAITYYAAGVIGYAAKGAHSVGYLPIPPEVALGGSIPLIGLGVYFFLHRLKSTVLTDPHKGK
mmetsp:Transcript_10440/g.32129  ORF Transcript_10440/g.32129 Transcript_10440/m.32129 type:complete len:202 (+) Transcript_10440:1127-1732(+)